MEEKLYILDAMTNDEEYRLTSFSDSIGGMVQVYNCWMNDNNLTQDDIWYADGFEGEEPEHYLSLERDDNGIINIIPAPKGSRVSLYKRSSLKHKLQMMLKRAS